MLNLNKSLFINHILFCTFNVQKNSIGSWISVKFHSMYIIYYQFKLLQYTLQIKGRYGIYYYGISLVFSPITYEKYI